jgi:hypothetical protein
VPPAPDAVLLTQLRHVSPAQRTPSRQVSYEFDGTREVTQNYLGAYKGDGQYLDIQVRTAPRRRAATSSRRRASRAYARPAIQGFSHKGGSIFDTFHAAHPTQPMMATECCSCMSQRGVDTDWCPEPKDGGCVGGDAAGLPKGTFYNNNIGECTAVQVAASRASAAAASSRPPQRPLLRRARGGRRSRPRTRATSWRGRSCGRASTTTARRAASRR